MDVLTTEKGQDGLPRYFATVFETAWRLGRGRLDFGQIDGHDIVHLIDQKPGLLAVQINDKDARTRMGHARRPAQPFGQTHHRHDIAAQICNASYIMRHARQRGRLLPFADFEQRGHRDAEHMAAQGEGDDLHILRGGGGIFDKVGHAAIPFRVKRAPDELAVETSASMSS